jgi:predicted phage terminase large subunit-like protein
MSFLERAVRRARAAPRGYAKSTITALIKPIHDICYGLERFIVVISNTSTQADQKLKDIRTEILTNTDLAAFYGVHFRRKNVGESQYIVHCHDRTCLFMAFGAATEIRGIRHGADRPTKIIVDDSEHSEEVENEALRQKYEDWYFQVVSKIGSETTNIDFVGTILHKDSLLSHLLKNPAYDGKKYRAVESWSEREDLWEQWRAIYTNIDNPNRDAEAELFFTQNRDEMLKGTKVLWPEKEPYVFLMKEMVETGRRAFFKEKQGEPLGGDDRLFDTFCWYRETMGLNDKGERVPGILIEKSGAFIPMSHLEHQCFGALDPSTGQTKAKVGKKSDYACALVGFKDPKGRLLVHHDWTKRAAPTAQIAQIFELHQRFNFQKFGVETNLYRNLLLPNIVEERKRREREAKKSIQIAFYDIENVDNKEKRIYTLEPKVTHGWILLNRALSEEFKNQLEAFPRGDHDDCPDALEMLWGLVNNRYRASALSIDPMGGR